MSNGSTWMIIGSSILLGVYLSVSLGARFFGLMASGLQDRLNQRYGFPRNVGTGVEGLVRANAVVKTVFRTNDEGLPEGWVLLRGELWCATSPRNQEPALVPGMQVRVVRVRGLTVEVEPLEQSADSLRSTGFTAG